MGAIRGRSVWMHPLIVCILLATPMTTTSAQATPLGIPVPLEHDTEPPQYRTTDLSQLTLGPERDGVLYGVMENTVFAIDATTGALQWRYDGNQPVLARGFVDDEFYAFTVDDDDIIIALDPARGRERWRYTDFADSDVWGFFATLDEGGLLLIDVWGEFGGVIVAVDAVNGDTRWTVPMQDLIDEPHGEFVSALVTSGPVVDGLVVTSGQWRDWSGDASSGVAAAVAIDDGIPAWGRLVGGFAFTVGASTDTVYVLTAPDVSLRSLDHLLALDLRTGHSRWERRFASPVVEAILDEGRLVVQSADDPIDVIDSGTGERLWQQTPPIPVVSIGAGAGLVFTVDDGGGVIAFDGPSGARRWKSAVWSAQRGGFVGATRFYVIGANGKSVDALAVADGTTEWSTNPFVARPLTATPTLTPPASPAIETAPSSSAATVTLLDITYEPNEVTIAAGTDQAMTLANQGATDYSFIIDALDVHSGNIQSGETKTVTINAPPGDYQYSCSIPGHNQAGMVGTFLVVVDEGGG